MPLILLYDYSDGRPTGPIKAVSATPSLWRGGHTVLPTNPITKPTHTHIYFAPKQHNQYVYFTQIRIPGHTSWQERIGNNLRHKQQHITHKYLCYKNHNPPPHTLLPASHNIYNYPAQTEPTRTPLSSPGLKQESSQSNI